MMTEDRTQQQDTSTTRTTSTGVQTADLAAAQTSSTTAANAEQESSDTATAVETRRTGESADAGERTPLFAEDDASDFRARWTEIQTGFVDEPQQAVEQADSLVAEVMQRLAQSFADERSTLEGQWHEGEDISTEDLRLALQRYRSFFDRLLTV